MLYFSYEESISNFSSRDSFDNYLFFDFGIFYT